MHVVELVTRALTSTRCEGCLTEGAPLCTDCVQVLGEPPKSSCIVCNNLTTDNKLCTNCRQKYKLHTLSAAFRYEGDPERIMRRYKFDGDRALAPSLAFAMVSQAQPFQYDYLVWVPSSPSRTRQRGFDHAALLGRALAKRLDVEVLRPLIRKGSNRQVGASRRSRFKQVTKQYTMSHGGPDVLSGKHILLVDDVVTTGATLSRCATLLRESGAKRVDALVFARR